MKQMILALFCLLHCLCEGQSRNIGDVIRNPDGSQGVIFWLHPDGSGGWMVALHDLTPTIAWGKTGVNVPTLNDMGIDSYASLKRALTDTDGYSNTAKLRTFQGSGSNYIAQVVDFANGWYIPAIAQLRKLYAVGPVINPILKANGGRPLKADGAAISDCAYYSSTEGNGQYAWCGLFDNGRIAVVEKNATFFVRPVRSFTNETIQYDTTLTYRWNTGEVKPGIKVSPAATSLYTVTARTSVGCAASASRQIFVASGQDTMISATICRGDVYRENGFEESQTGIYPRQIQGAEGCTMTLTLSLTVVDPVDTLFVDTICENELYTAHNFSAWKPGIYTQTWPAANGCDSIVTLHLSVTPVSYDTIVATICAGEIYDPSGYHATVAGNYTRRFENAGGCDSLETLVLTVLPIYDDTITAVICEGDVYTGHGFHESTTGLYSQSLQSVSGCDSIVWLHLTVNPTYHLILAGSFCQGDSYTFNDEQLTEAGVYDYLLTTQSGCDSLVQFRLSENPVCTTSFHATICKGESYRENGFDASETGYYEHSLQSATGCDSLVTLDLRVEEYFNGTIAAVLEDCETHRYSFYTEEVALASPMTWKWSLDEGITDLSDPEPQYTYRDSGNYRIALSVTTGDACERTMYYLLHVPYYLRDVRIYADRTSVDAETPAVSLQATQIEDWRYEWDMGDGAFLSGWDVRHVYGLIGREYYDVHLTATNPDDCAANATLRIAVFPPVHAPNTFSPNGDGVNDLFKPGYRVEIIDRNGMEIYKGDNGWDGTYKGVPAIADTYFFRLFYPTARGEKMTIGYIMLAR